MDGWMVCWTDGWMVDGWIDGWMDLPEMALSPSLQSFSITFHGPKT